MFFSYIIRSARIGVKFEFFVLLPPQLFFLFSNFKTTIQRGETSARERRKTTRKRKEKKTISLLFERKCVYSSSEYNMTFITFFFFFCLCVCVLLCCTLNFCRRVHSPGVRNDNSFSEKKLWLRVFFFFYFFVGRNRERLERNASW